MNKDRFRIKGKTGRPRPKASPEIEALKYDDLIKVIPKMPEDRILELIAHLRLELLIRSKAE